MSKVYVIGSLRNPAIPQVAEMLRSLGHEVFDDWYAAGPEADDYWQKYERAKGSSFAEALAGFAAQHVFAFDKKHLDACDIAVMVMPAGKSAHLELGYCKGLGKQTVIFMDKEPERFDVMYNFADKVCISDEELIQYLSHGQPQFEDTSFGSLNPWPFPLPTPRGQFYAEADADNVAAPVVPAARNDGMPASVAERHLRRLLAARVAIPHYYHDDGEASGEQYGIKIDFMRDDVVEIDAKLRTLNIARLAAPVAPARAGRWVSIEEGLPAEYRDVIVRCRKDGETWHCVGRVNQHRQWDKATYSHNIKGQYGISDVVAWLDPDWTAEPVVPASKSCATCKGCDGAYAPASFGRDCTGYQRERG